MAPDHKKGLLGIKKGRGSIRPVLLWANLKGQQHEEESPEEKEEDDACDEFE